MSSLLEKLYKKIDEQSSFFWGFRPLIGISANRKDGLSCIEDTYFQLVEQAGGAPIILPVSIDNEYLTTIMDHLDGLILSGEEDIDPAYMGKASLSKQADREIVKVTDSHRDENDFIILKLAFNRQLPIFGINRGHHVINVAFGGMLYQDIDTHHQAVKELAPEFIATAISSDGLIEAMEHPEYSIYSVQWHPDAIVAAGNDKKLAIFQKHVQQASIFKKAKHLHTRIETIDSHTDTPTITQSFDLGIKEGSKVNLPLMREGIFDAVFMVAFVQQGARDDASLFQATQYVEERLSAVIAQSEKYNRFMEIATTPNDLRRIKQAGKKAVFLGIENGYAIGKNLDNLIKFKELGVSYITLCHNGDNDICDSAAGQEEWGGLSPFGKQVVAEMNRLGMMIDVSHATDYAFYDVLTHSTKPVIASHSSSRAICNHPRNLNDNQLRAIAAKGGVVQLCLYKHFINEDAEKASLSDALRHLDHIIAVAGIDHVGIGSDFDGGGELIGCRAVNELIGITKRLIAKEFDDDSIAKIWGGNLLRVMRNQLFSN